MILKYVLFQFVHQYRAYYSRNFECIFPMAEPQHRTITRIYRIARMILSQQYSQIETNLMTVYVMLSINEGNQ